MTLPWTQSRPAMIAAAGGLAYEDADHRFRFFLCCLCSAGTVAFSFMSPQIIRWTIDSVIGSDPLAAPAFVQALFSALGGAEVLRRNLWICALFVFASALISGLLNMGRRYTSLELGETVAWRLRNNLYAHIQRLPYDWHVGCQTGDIIQRCTTDVDNIRNFMQNHFAELLRIIFVFVFALWMMFSMDVVMSLASLVLTPLILVFSYVYFKKVQVQFAKADAAEGAVQAASQENYTGVRVVRAFGREAYEMQRFAEKTAEYGNIWIRIGKMLGTFWGAGDLFSGLQLALVVGAGVWRSVTGDLTAGTFLAFYTYSNAMIWPVRQLGRILSEMSKTLVSAGRVRDILKQMPENYEEAKAEAYPPLNIEEIKYESVSFAYPDTKATEAAKLVLHDISFSIRPGKTLAILGATGSGKSTLVHLLSRLYDVPNELGKLTINGVDIRDIPRQVLRRNIGLCLQEPFLFSKTIGENIAIASPGLGETGIREAAAVAQVNEAISEFPDGYKTIVGERGVTLSGGQKQRVAIARMLAAKPPVMIFDDSLSAVDTETDARIRAALHKRVKDAAVIIISHRISSLMQADEILVLKNGAIEEIGSHEELIKRRGTYHRVWAIQKGILEEEL